MNFEILRNAFKILTLKIVNLNDTTGTTAKLPNYFILPWVLETQCLLQLESILHGLQDDHKSLQLECSRCGKKIQFLDYSRHLDQCEEKSVSKHLSGVYPWPKGLGQVIMILAENLFDY